MNWDNKTVLITGVGGFIGHNLAEKLLKKNVNVIGIDNFSFVQKKWIKDIEKDIHLLEANVANPRIFTKIKRRIDYIFCFGSPSSVVLFNKNPKECYSQTILGTKNVFEFGEKIGVEKIILPSTGSVYSGNKEPHKETIYPKPRNLYATAKIACEGIASTYKPFVKSIALRIFAGYGPGEEKKGEFASTVYLFIHDMLRGKSPVIYGDGSQERDFIYIEDVIECIIRAATIDFHGVLNVGTGNATSFLKLMEIIKKEIDKDIKPKYIPQPKNYTDSLAAETTRMNQLLKIKPQNIEDGIKKFVAYLQEKYSY